MSKAHPKPQKTKSSNQPKRIYFIHPWKCQRHADRWEITAYAETSGNWETALTVHPTSGASAEAIATFIVDLVNDHQSNRNLLLEAMQALELVLEEGGLTYASEQDADSVVSRIRKRIGQPP